MTLKKKHNAIHNYNDANDHDRATTASASSSSAAAAAEVRDN